MKAIIKILLISFAFLVSTQSVLAQDKKSKQEKKDMAFKEMQAMIEEGQFIFVPNRAFPQGHQSIDLTTNYGFLKFKGDKAESDMPFFGRGFQGHYGNDGGIKFKGEMTNKKIELNEKKRTISFSFEVKDDDYFRVNMEIGYNGSTSVNVNSNKRSHISYQGNVEKLEEEKQK